MQSKKQAFNLIESITELNDGPWNNKRGTYSDDLEASLQIEESLEGFNDLHYLATTLREVDSSPKAVARSIVEAVNNCHGSSGIPDVDRFDKHLDGIYIHIGSLHKLGLTPYQIVEGLQVVHNANLQKLGTKDSSGKVTKPADFVPPEPLLQEILDKRPPL